MPNWASFDYKIVASKKEDLKVLDDAFKLMQEKNLVKNGFGNLWLGNLVTALGGDWKEISCRGEITDYELDDNVFSMSAEWAWWQSDEFVGFLSSKLPEDTKIYWIGEEPGLDTFCTNDREGVCFDSKYLADWNFNNDEGYEYLPDLPALQLYVAEHIFPLIDDNLRKKLDFSDCDDDNMPCTFSEICKLLDKIEKECDDPDCFFSFHEFKYSEY